MKVVIFGGRDFTDQNQMHVVLSKLHQECWIIDPILICGMARGADMTAHKLFTLNDLPIEEYPANWDRYGNRAGPIRNTQMAQIADRGVGFWDGKSKGTKHMIDQLEKLNKPLVIYRY